MMIIWWVAIMPVFAEGQLDHKKVNQTTLFVQSETDKP